MEDSIGINGQEYISSDSDTDCDCFTSDCDCSGYESNFDSEIEDEEYQNISRINFDSTGEVKHKSIYFDISTQVKYKKYYRPISKDKFWNNDIPMDYPDIGSIVKFSTTTGIILANGGDCELIILPLNEGKNKEPECQDARDWDSVVGYIDIQHIFNSIWTIYNQGSKK